MWLGALDTHARVYVHDNSSGDRYSLNGRFDERAACA
jgi:hypothetical protein